MPKAACDAFADELLVVDAVKDNSRPHRAQYKFSISVDTVPSSCSVSSALGEMLLNPQLWFGHGVMMRVVVDSRVKIYTLLGVRCRRSFRDGGEAGLLS